MADMNPYQSPDAEVATDRPIGTGERVYKAWHTGLATFLGTPLAGFWLMGSNFVALGEPGRRGSMIWAGIAAAVFVLVLAFFVPDGVPGLAVNVAVVAGMIMLCNSVQGEALKEYVEDDILWYSGWRAAGVGLLFLLGIFVLLFVVLLIASFVGFNFFLE